MYLNFPPALRLSKIILVLLSMLAGPGCATLGQTGQQELSVDDFSFDGPLGSDGARIEKLGRNHFLVTLGHAPNQPGWPNKLNFQIPRNAAGKDLRLEVRFPGGPAYSFNEYHQSYSYDGVHWNPIAWEKGRTSPQHDELRFPPFTADRAQLPISRLRLFGSVGEVRHASDLDFVVEP